VAVLGLDDAGKTVTAKVLKGGRQNFKFFSLFLKAQFHS